MQDIPCSVRHAVTVFMFKPPSELSFRYRNSLFPNADYRGCSWDKGGKALLEDRLPALEYLYHGLPGREMEKILDAARTIPGWHGKTINGQRHAYPIIVSELDVRATLDRQETITQLAWLMNYGVHNSIDWSSYEIPTAFIGTLLRLAGVSRLFPGVTGAY